MSLPADKIWYSTRPVRGRWWIGSLITWSTLGTRPSLCVAMATLRVTSPRGSKDRALRSPMSRRHLRSFCEASLPVPRQPAERPRVGKVCPACQALRPVSIGVRYCRQASVAGTDAVGTSCGAIPGLAAPAPRDSDTHDQQARPHGYAPIGCARHRSSAIRCCINPPGHPGRGQRYVPAVYTKTMTTALRGYLRFLGTLGLCRAELVHAVPTIPQWRLSAMPRYLPAVNVERMIASCNASKACGVRDKAILLLLARLGLRAGDVLDLQLGHVCWTDGTLRVCGKGRREVCLPLPQEVGDALLDYICRARPVSDSDVVFLRSIAPYQPFAGSSTISTVVRWALVRAAISDPPSRGANLLRHSAATSMLRAGATLDTIGAVLRHRSATTTAHYAKVDIPMLLEVAQLWPGAASC